MRRVTSTLFGVALAAMTAAGPALAAPPNFVRSGHGHHFGGGHAFGGGGTQFRRGGYDRGGRYGYHRRGYGGAAIGAGIAGLAAGAIVGGALANRGAYAYGPEPYPVAADPGYYAPAPAVDGDAVAYCSQRFKSYDPASGTYLGYDGIRHPCP